MTSDPVCERCLSRSCECELYDAVPTDAQVVELYPADDEDERRQRETDDQLLAGVRSGTWLDGQTFPPLEYAVPGVVPEGFTVLAGAPKVGKSWMILGLCLAVASGGRALGSLPVDSRDVFYLALEDGDRRLQDRIRQLIPDEAIPARFHYLTRVDSGRIRPTLDAWIRRNPRTGLIVLDTLGRVMPPARQGETSFQRDYAVGASLKHVSDAHPGLALVVVHHDRKAQSADFVDAVSGTNGIAGSADTIVLLSRDRHSTTGLLHVTGRDVHEAEYALDRLPSGSWQLTGGTLDSARAAADDARAALQLDRHSDRMRDVVELVRRNPEGITPAAADTELELPPGHAKVYLRRALNAGLVDKAGRGHYVPAAPPVPSVPVFPGTGLDPLSGTQEHREHPLLLPDEWQLLNRTDTDPNRSTT